MRKQAFPSAFDRKSKSDKPFFSPVKKMTGIESTFFQKKSEQPIPSMNACLRAPTRSNANFNNPKFVDGIATNSDTKYGKFVTIEYLDLDIFKILFEKSAEFHGRGMDLELHNSTIAKEFIQTNDKVELKLNIPSMGLSWELFIGKCDKLRIGYGVKL